MMVEFRTKCRNLNFANSEAIINGTTSKVSQFAQRVLIFDWDNIFHESMFFRFPFQTILSNVNFLQTIFITKNDYRESSALYWLLVCLSKILFYYIIDTERFWNANTGVI